MADSTTTATNSQAPAVSGNSDLTSGVLGNYLAGQAEGNVASTDLGNASTQENSAISTLQSIESSIASALPPNLQALAQPLAQLMYVGKYNVDQVQNAVQQITQTAGATLDPQTLATQKQDLSQLQAQAQVGYTPQQKAQILDTMNSIQAQTQGGNSAILQQLQQQGQGGPINSLAARLINEQQGAISAASSGATLAAGQQSQENQSVTSAAGLAGTIQGQESNLALTQAQAQDAINANNASLLQQANTTNAAAQNTASSQQQNINSTLEQQNVQNQLSSQQQQINAGATDYSNELQNLGLQESNAGQQASVETQYGTAAQHAGLTAQNNSALDSAAATSQGLSGLVNGLTNSSSGSGGSSNNAMSSTGTPNLTATGASSGANSTTDINNITGGLSADSGYKDGGETPSGDVSGPGGPKDDLIPARLSNGEFVINAESTDKYRPVLHAINKGAEPEEVGSLLKRLIGKKEDKQEETEEPTGFHRLAEFA